MNILPILENKNKMNNQKISTIATPTKVCFKCEQEKPLSEFPRRSDSPDGYRNECKVCGAKRKRAWAEANRERVAETKRAWHEANREHIAERWRAYYQANREHFIEYQRTYRADYPERVAKVKRTWAKANPDKVKATQARALARYPERHSARCAVNNAIRDGRLPSPRDLPCSVCGEPAQQYHHHRGYEREHRLDVVPMCIPCHFKMPEYTADPGEGGEEGE